MFADSFKNLRIRSGLTQEELAEKLGKAKSTISMYENGNREPDYETLEEIADFFNVDINTLVDSKQSVQFNEELTEYLEELKNRSELRMLFKLAKNATKQDVEQAVRIIEAIAKKDE